MPHMCHIDYILWVKNLPSVFTGGGDYVQVSDDQIFHLRKYPLWVVPGEEN